MDLREIALSWYNLLTGLSAGIREPLLALSNGVGAPFVAPLLLGLLGATAPCQLTTNSSALAFVARRLDKPREPMLAMLGYLLGKALVYVLVGTAAVAAGRELATEAIPVFVVVRKALGPLMILIGLFFLGVVRLNVSIGQGLSAWFQNRAGTSGTRSGFLLGVAFGFAFCPTLFWLFFGLMIPLALRSPFGMLYPPAFALGTTLPLLGLVGLLVVGIGQTTRYLSGFRSANRVLGWAAGAILILAGLNDTLVYWLL